MANSKHVEYIGISRTFEDVCGMYNTLHMPNAKDGTRNEISDEVSELSVPGKQLDQQPQTHQLMIGQTTQTNQMPEFLEDEY